MKNRITFAELIKQVYSYGKTDNYHFYCLVRFATIILFQFTFSESNKLTWCFSHERNKIVILDTRVHRKLVLSMSSCVFLPNEIVVIFTPLYKWKYKIKQENSARTEMVQDFGLVAAENMLFQSKSRDSEEALLFSETTAMILKVIFFEIIEVFTSSYLTATFFRIV